MPQESPFETHYAEYDAWFDEHANVYQSELLAIRALLPPQGTWVEIGVGSGRFASQLGIKTGIEPAAGIAGLARERGVDVIRGSAEDLPLPDASVDAAFLITTVCFVSDMDRAFHEVARVLRPAGAAIVAFVPKDSPLGALYAETADRDRFLKHATLRARADVVDGLTKAGLTIERATHTLTGDPATCDERIEAPHPGYDRGSFVVVRAVKRTVGERRAETAVPPEC
jgi:SAM-dependent methyltransferase